MRPLPLLCLILAAGNARAAELRKACISEISFLCSGAVKDDELKACLEENRKSLLSACKAALSGKPPPQSASPAAQEAPSSPAEERPEEGLTVTTRRETYELRGADAKSLRRVMNAAGPASPVTGKRYSALTTSKTRWRYKFDRGASGCALKEPKVSIEVTITMPSWADQALAPGRLQHNWDGYFAGLLAHEEGHKDLIVAKAREILARLRTFEAKPTCDALDQAANAAGNVLLAGARNEHAAYDLATNHGKTSISPLRD